MNKNVRNAGLALLAAGALAYPAMKLYRYVKQRRDDNVDDQGHNNNNHKAFAPAYRADGRAGKRKLEHNGRMPL